MKCIDFESFSGGNVKSKKVEKKKEIGFLTLDHIGRILNYMYVY